MIKTYKDFLGNELYIGDRVVFTDKHYATLKHGEIINLNEKQATIRDLEYCKDSSSYDKMGYGKTCRYYCCIIKLLYYYLGENNDL